MLRTTVIGLAAIASLSLAALTPALADVPACVKQPNADTCPTMGTPTPAAGQQIAPKLNKHTHYRSTQSPYKG